jgi:hypothetical protein
MLQNWNKTVNWQCTLNWWWNGLPPTLACISVRIPWQHLQSSTSSPYLSLLSVSYYLDLSLFHHQTTTRLPLLHWWRRSGQQTRHDQYWPITKRRLDSIDQSTVRSRPTWLNSHPMSGFRCLQSMPGEVFGRFVCLRGRGITIGLMLFRTIRRTEQRSSASYQRPVQIPGIALRRPPPMHSEGFFL